jgi:hypothetical protein
MRVQVEDENLFTYYDGATWTDDFPAARFASLTVVGETTFGDAILLGGASKGDAAADRDDQVWGDGSANDFGGTFSFVLGNKCGFAWNDGINIKDGDWWYNGFAFTARTQNVDRFELNETEMKALTSGVNLGGVTTVQRWATGYINRVVLGVMPSGGTITVDEDGLIIVDASGGTVDVDLPTAVEGLDYDLIVKSVANTVTANADTGDNVNGAASQVITVIGRYRISCEDTANWHLHGPIRRDLGVSHYSRVKGDNGAGSTNTNILRWDAEEESGGSDITYTDSATDGGYWTANVSGTYTVSVSFDAPAGDYAINTKATLDNTFGQPHNRARVTTPSTGWTSFSWTGFVSSGDKIWISSDGDVLNVSAGNQATVVHHP